MSAAVAASEAVVAITLSRHAVQRYQERVRPGLDAARAEEDLQRLVAAADVQPLAPMWCRSVQLALCYAVIGDVCLPLERDRRSIGRLIATTCLTPGWKRKSRGSRPKRRRGGRR
jgi:hypothetical protein